MILFAQHVSQHFFAVPACSGNHQPKHVTSQPHVLSIMQGLAAGGRGTSEAASLQLPGAQAGAGTAAAAVLLRHLCNGDALCAMLGVTMQSAERLHPADPQEVHAAERPTGTVLWALPRNPVRTVLGHCHELMLLVLLVAHLMSLGGMSLTM